MTYADRQNRLRPTNNRLFDNRSNVRGSLSGVSCRIFLDNLSHNLTEKDLEGEFSRAGPIKNVTIFYTKDGRSTGTGEIEFFRQSDGAIAMRDYDKNLLFGKQLRMKFLEKKDGTRDITRRIHERRSEGHFQLLGASSFGFKAENQSNGLYRNAQEIHHHHYHYYYHHDDKKNIPGHFRKRPIKNNQTPPQTTPNRQNKHPECSCRTPGSPNSASLSSSVNLRTSDYLEPWQNETSDQSSPSSNGRETRSSQSLSPYY